MRFLIYMIKTDRRKYVRILSRLYREILAYPRLPLPNQYGVEKSAAREKNALTGSLSSPAEIALLDTKSHSAGFHAYHA